MIRRLVDGPSSYRHISTSTVIHHAAGSLLNLKEERSAFYTIPPTSSSSSIRSFHASNHIQAAPFLYVLPFLFAKKMGAWGAYQAAEKYGFHNVYRRLLEGIKRLDIPPERANLIRTSLKECIRAPTRASKVLNDYRVIEFVEKYSEIIIKEANLPPFFVAVANVIVGKTSIFKAYSVIKKAAMKK